MPPDESRAPEGEPASPIPPADGTDAPAPPPESAADARAAATALRVAEAVLFASDRPVALGRLADALAAAGVPEADPLATLLALRDAYAGRGVVVAEVAGGWALRTAPDLAPALTRVVEVPRRLPRSAVEALAVLAWREREGHLGGTTRAEIEEARGGSALPQSGLDALLEAGLIAPRGQKPAPGRPTLWATTPRFLEQFGLRALADLPRDADLFDAAEAAPTSRP